MAIIRAKCDQCGKEVGPEELSGYREGRADDGRDVCKECHRRDQIESLSKQIDLRSEQIDRLQKDKNDLIEKRRTLIHGTAQ